MFHKESQTKLTQQRYNRMAPIYDVMEFLIETTRFGPWRKNFWKKVKGPRVLEVGVGTGKNIPYYPSHLNLTALDLSPGMLKKAKHKAKKYHNNSLFINGDVQNLPFEDG